MYYRHFGLNGPPFEFTASPVALYLGREHSEALAALEWGLLREPSGYTLFVGEPGIGKTTLVCTLLAKHYEQVRAVYLNHPKFSFDELMVLINRQLGIETDQPGKLACLEAFDRFLRELRPQLRVVIIIDEAQALSDETFEELRLLSDHGRNDERQVQLVLVGQSELLQRLQSPRLKQLDERIGARTILHPLESEEIEQYIEHRLRLRNGTIASVFSRPALKLAIEHGQGIPRRVNILCHNAMLNAFAEGAKLVKFAAMQAAVAEYDSASSIPPVGARVVSALPPMGQRFGRALRTGALLAGFSLAGVVATFAWQSKNLSFEPAAPMVFLRDHIVRALNPNTLWPVTGNPPVDVNSPLSGEANASTAPAAAKPIAAPPNPPASATTRSPAAVPAKTAAVNPPAKRRRAILVATGDTIEGYALRYYGNREALNDIARSNPQIDNIDRIYPGQIVYLPTTMHEHAGN
jgi:general secretion pathway protein A